ncbi:MAG: prepilin-type N-terminal cleavage/methylation domain-containing protein [Candidatus Wallbacteria bacterium]|nr:prepilin-type N-terminal cleavage/methylation domain-containing protein [Candidatus Wallbacteria bacterium]
MIHFRAFTLLELMIVVAIIGLVTSIAYPNMSHMYYDYQLDGDVTAFCADLRFLMNESLSNKEIMVMEGTSEAYITVCYGMVIETRRSYSLWRFRYDAAQSSWKPDDRLQSDESYLFSAGVSISDFPGLDYARENSSPYYILFTEKGLPTSNGFDPLPRNEFIFRSSFTNAEKRVILDPNTGKPRSD